MLDGLNPSSSAKKKASEWMLFSIIFVPDGTGDIPSELYRTLCDDICLRHVRNGYYIMQCASLYNMRRKPYIISHQRYIITSLSDSLNKNKVLLKLRQQEQIFYRTRYKY